MSVPSVPSAETEQGCSFLIDSQVVFPQLADELLEQFDGYPTNISADYEDHDDPFISPEGKRLVLHVAVEGMDRGRMREIVQECIAGHHPNVHYGETLYSMETVKAKLADGHTLSLEEVSVALRGLLT